MNAGASSTSGETKFHMRRAAEAFEAHAIEVVPMITGFPRPVPESILSWTPSFEA